LSGDNFKPEVVIVLEFGSNRATEAAPTLLIAGDEQHV
jgi:hypothetical protein